MDQPSLGCFRCEEILPKRTPMCIVYRAVNAVNGKRYIGMTTTGLAKRKNGHLLASKRGKHIFAKAIRKYGFDNFHFSIVEECLDRESAYEREKHLIELHRPEYNCTAGGRGTLGIKLSPESIAKMKATWVARGIKPRPPAPIWTESRINVAKAVLVAQGLCEFKRIKCLNDGNEFLGAKAAGTFYGLSDTVVRRSCLGMRKPKCGLLFEYVSEPIKMAA